MLLDTPICDFGWQAPSFELKDFDGKDYKLEDSLKENGLLIAFICNHCPYVQAIIDRLVSDAKELQANGVNILAVMSNDYKSYPADNPDAMRIFAKEHDFTFPYLIDEDQIIAKSYDAVCTPDFFGFNSNGELQYRGRLDDGKMNSNTRTDAELLNAMLSIAKTGKGPDNQIPSMGCSIKWA